MITSYLCFNLSLQAGVSGLRAGPVSPGTAWRGFHHAVSLAVRERFLPEDMMAPPHPLNESQAQQYLRSPNRIFASVRPLRIVCRSLSLRLNAHICARLPAPSSPALCALAQRLVHEHEGHHGLHHRDGAGEDARVVEVLQRLSVHVSSCVGVINMNEVLVINDFVHQAIDALAPTIVAMPFSFHVRDPLHPAWEKLLSTA